MSNIIRKVEEAIHPDKRERGPAGAAAHPPVGTGVTHTPAAPGTAGTGANPGVTYPSAGNYTNTGGGANLPGPAPNTAGPHRYDVLNKLDPGVDSKPGAGMTTSPALAPPITGTGGTNVPEGTYGPHSSRVANAADPRVDSDLDRRHHHQHPPATGAAASGAPGVGGGVPVGHSGVSHSGGIPEGTYGPHGNRVANALDPRVDSDGDRAPVAPGIATTSTKPPHHSSLLNKLDPEVDNRATHRGI